MLAHLVLPDHDLLDQVALPELDEVRPVEGARDLSAGDKCEALDALKVGVLDAHDAGLGEQGLGPVVDELAVDEAVDAVLLDLLHLGLHLLALGALELGELARALDAEARAKDLDLVRVHRGVGDEDLGVAQLLGAVDPDLLSRMNPSDRYDSVSLPPTFLMIWMFSRFVEPWSRPPRKRGGRRL